MATAWIFIDEQGDAKFGPMNSTHFGLAAVTTTDPVGLSRGIDELRHALWLDGTLRRGSFHAQEDTWPTRRRVLQLFPALPIARTDVIALTKAGIYDTLRSPDLVYRTALRLLFGHLLPLISSFDQIIFVVAAWPPVRRLAMLVSEVLVEGGLEDGVRVIALSAQVHAGLQIADYVAWASHRARIRREAWVSYTRPVEGGWSDLTVFS